MIDKKDFEILGLCLDIINEMYSSFECQYYTWRALMKSCKTIEDSDFDYSLNNMYKKLEEAQSIIDNLLIEKDPNKEEEYVRNLDEKLQISSLFEKSFLEKFENTYKAFIAECQREKDKA